MKYVKAVIVGLAVIGAVFLILSQAMATVCKECPKPTECPDCVCECSPIPDCICKPDINQTKCPDCNCSEIPNCSCPECPDLVCPDPCPNPCDTDVDTKGSYNMIGLGGALDGKPEVIVGTLTIFPGEEVGVAYQCLVIGSFSNIGCSAYLLKKK